MVDVFISYSRDDLASVEILSQRIKEAGYKLWWDAELPAHKSYGDVIMEKIAVAKAAVVVWSPSAVKSEWVRAEADLARNHNKLVQAALGDLALPLPFNQIQFADISDWQGEDDHPGWIKIKGSLAELCGSRTQGKAKPIVRPLEKPKAKADAGSQSAKAGATVSSSSSGAKRRPKPATKTGKQRRSRVWARRTSKVMSETIDFAGLALIAGLAFIVFGLGPFGTKADEQTTPDNANPISIAGPQNEPPIENLPERPQITPQPLTQVESPTPSESGTSDYKVNGEEVIIDPLRD